MSNQVQNTITSNTADAGIELTYNKRNRSTSGLRWKDLENLDPTLKINEAKKSKIFPKPDYEALVINGVHPMIAHIVKQAYDSIATEPVTRDAPSDDDLKMYIESVHQYMDGVLKWATNKELSNSWMLDIARRAGSNMSALKGQVTALSDLIPTKQQTLLQTVYGSNWKDHLASIRIIGSNKPLSALQPSLDDAVRAMKDINKGWPGKLESWQKQGYRIVDKAEVNIELRENEKKVAGGVSEKYVTAWVALNEGARTYHIDVERFDVESKNNTVVVEFQKETLQKLSNKYLLLNKTNHLVDAFDTLDGATNRAREITKRTKETSEINEKGVSVEAASRVGQEWRENNRDISSNELIEVFGFKGVNFGNWMKGKNNEIERQLHLNHIFDSFMDMSHLLGVSPRMMSLEGMLGIAVGAQGNGKNAAHFMPGLNELNFTRTSGAGLMAHEWAHAFDHFIARTVGLERDANPFFSEHIEDVNSSIHPEIQNAFKNVVDAMNNRPMTIEEIANVKSKEVEKADRFVDSWLKGIRQQFDSYVSLEENVEHPLSPLFQKIRERDYGELIAGKYYPIVENIRQKFKEHTKKNLPTNLANGLQTNLRNVYLILLRQKNTSTNDVKMTLTDYAESAKNLDLDKGGKPYWSTNAEKFARAFDVYISNVLEQKGLLNSYLSLAGRNDKTTPNGEDRAIINAKINDLVKLICNLDMANKKIMQATPSDLSAENTQETSAPRNIFKP